MSIGRTILEHRTKKHLSQGQLAELLDVSRQSVSKWETDAAVPDLDKLMKLCDVFEISMDELTGRTTPQAHRQSAPPMPSAAPSVQRLLGYILFTAAVLLGAAVLLFGTNQADFLILLPFDAALLVCGLLCLFAGRKALYWCIWTIFAPAAILSPFFLRFYSWLVLAVAFLFFAVCMAFAARIVYWDTIVEPSRRVRRLLVLGWILTAALYALYLWLVVGLSRRAVPTSYSTGLAALLNLLCYVLTAVWETCTVCFLKGRKKQPAD